MPIMDWLQKLQKKIYNKKSNSFLQTGYAKQKSILDSFDVPKSLTERSYFQYLCQMNNVTIFLRFFQNLISLPIIFFYLIKPANKAFNTPIKKGALFLREGVSKNIIPESLQYEFPEILEAPLRGTQFLNKENKKFLKNTLIKYMRSPFFVLKCWMKASIYSEAILRNNPNAIITHNEYSFTSSFLTRFCRELGVEHINIMHGEKLFNINDSFVEYDRFYVWDEHYKNLMIELLAESNQFKVECPRTITLNIDPLCTPKYFLTYYLGAENEYQLKNIYKNLLRINVSIETICIRYHPRHSNFAMIKNIFRGCTIENPEEVKLEQSICQCKYVVSLYSTVLYQAYINGKIVVIDDVTQPEEFKKLKELHYIILSKPHRLLSNLQEVNEVK